MEISVVRFPSKSTSRRDGGVASGLPVMVNTSSEITELGCVVISRAVGSPWRTLKLPTLVIVVKVGVEKLKV